MRAKSSKSPQANLEKTLKNSSCANNTFGYFSAIIVHIHEN